MKKKILFCIHNYFFLRSYILDLKRLEKNFDITIIVSNYLIDDKKKEESIKLKKEINFKNFFIVPYYKNGEMKRSFSSILYTHLYLLKKKKENYVRKI